MACENDEEGQSLLNAPPTAKRTQRSTASWFLLIAAAISIVLHTVALYRIHNWTATVAPDKICAAHIQQYESPLLEDINVRFDTVRYNGSFLKETIFRQRPSPEVDAAWDAIGASLEGFIVPEKDGARFGLDPGMVKRVPEQGGGFVVLSEGIHHLHCLNVLRQSSYFNFAYYRELRQGAFVNEDSILEKHIGHCVDILRQQLSCRFDTAVFGQWWVEGVGPFVDFNTNHRCVNSDSLEKWVMQHQLSRQDLVEFRDGDKMLEEIP